MKKRDKIIGTFHVQVIKNTKQKLGSIFMWICSYLFSILLLYYFITSVCKYVYVHVCVYVHICL